MNRSSAHRPPSWFWAVAVLALLWNLIGVAAYLMQAYEIGPGLQTSMTPRQRELDASMPAWVMGAYATAVFSGVAGAAGLLLRRRWAKLLLALSLVAVLAQQSWVFLLSDAMRLLGQEAAILPLFVMAVALFLAWFAFRADRRGWLG